MYVEYHKGQPCVNAPIICQEGYCFKCGINCRDSLYRELVDENPEEHSLIQVETRELVGSLVS